MLKFRKFRRKVFVVPLLYQNKKADSSKSAYPFVQAERLELSHLAALDPKSSVSTNSTTPANLDCKYKQLFGYTNRF